MRECQLLKWTSEKELIEKTDTETEVEKWEHVMYYEEQFEVGWKQKYKCKRLHKYRSNNKTRVEKSRN